MKNESISTKKIVMTAFFAAIIYLGIQSFRIPLPAAVVKYTNFISIREVNDDLEALQSFYEKQDFSSVGMRVDFSTQDGEKRLQIKKKQLLNKLIEDRVVDILVK